MPREPEALEKYKVAFEALDLFFCRVLGTERGQGFGDWKGLRESLCGRSSGDGEVNKLRVQVQDLERQLCAVQRQLQMQGEVSQRLAASLDGRLEEVVRQCERRISESTKALLLRVEAVPSGVARLEKEVGDRANSGGVMALSEEVAQLKKTLGARVTDVEKKANEGNQALMKKIEGEIERLDAVVNMIPPGVIAYLTRECGGNVHQMGVVEVTASSRDGGRCAVELGTNSSSVCLVMTLKSRSVSRQIRPSNPIASRTHATRSRSRA